MKQRSHFLILFQLLCGYCVLAQGRFNLTEMKRMESLNTMNVLPSPDGTYLVSECYTWQTETAAIGVWKPSAGAYALSYTVPNSVPKGHRVNEFSISNDGNLLAMTCDNGMIYVFRRTATSFKKIQTLTDAEEGCCVHFSADGSYMSTHGGGRSVIYRIKGDAFSVVWSGERQGLLVFSPVDNNIIFRSGADDSIGTFNGTKLSSLQPFTKDNWLWSPDKYAFSPDGKYFASMGGTNHVFFLSKRQEDGSYKEIWRDKGFYYYEREFITFSSDSRYLTVYNYKPSSGKQDFTTFKVDGDSLAEETKTGQYSEAPDKFYYISSGKLAIADWGGAITFYKVEGVKPGPLFREKPVITSGNTINTTTIVKTDTIVKTKPVETITNMIWITPNPDVLNDKPVVSEKEMIEIQVKVMTNKPVTKDDIKIILNGKELQKNKFNEVSLTEGPKSELNEFTYINMIPLEETPDNINTIEVYANGKKCAKPLKVLFSGPKPNLHILSISSAPDQPFSKKDAQDFGALFSDQWMVKKPAFGSVNVKMLTGSEATTNAIKEAIEGYRYAYKSGAMGPKDVLLIFISAPAFMNNNELRMKGGDYKDMYKETYSFSYAEILSRLKDVGCKKIIFLDACFGGMKKAETGELNKAIGSFSNQPDGTITFCSTSGEESSFGNDDWQNSAFVYAIKKGLRDGMADKDADGSVTLGELSGFISQKIPDLVSEAKKGRTQNPFTPSLADLFDLVLFVNAK